jgi:hypothetical protein
MSSLPLQTRIRRRELGLLDDVPRCSKCDGPNDRAPQRYCRACNRAYQQNWKRSMVLVPRRTLTDEQAKLLRPRRAFT